MTLLPINLPKGFSPTVSVDDKVKQGDIVAENKSFSEETIIDLFKDFGISPKNLDKSLKKHLGDAVIKGEEIAVVKKILGSIKVLSKTSGTITKIDSETGKIYLKSADGGTTQSLNSPVEGTVNFCNNEKIVIKTNAKALLAKDALGQNGKGQLLVLKLGSEDFEKAEGKILVTQKVERMEFFKALSLGALGIITKDLGDLDFLELTEKGINIPIFIVGEKEFEKLEQESGSNIFADVKNKVIMIL